MKIFSFLYYLTLSLCGMTTMMTIRSAYSFEVPNACISSIQHNEIDRLFAPIIEDIAYLAEQSKGTNSLPIISISGITGVGKTSFTQLLQESLAKHGIRAGVLHMDDFTQREPVEGALLPFHKHFDNQKAHAFIQGLLQGKRIMDKPTWVITPTEKKNVVTTADYTDDQVILFEGTFTICDETSFDFQKYSALMIFVDANVNDIFNWKWERGRRSDRMGFTDKDEWLASGALQRELFKQIIDPCVKEAHYIIKKDSEHKYALQIQARLRR